MDYTRRLQPQVNTPFYFFSKPELVVSNHLYPKIGLGLFRLLTFRVEKFLNGQVITETFDHGNVDILAHGLSVSVNILA